MLKGNAFRVFYIWFMGDRHRQKYSANSTEFLAAQEAFEFALQYAEEIRAKIAELDARDASNSLPPGV